MFKNVFEEEINEESRQNMSPNLTKLNVKNVERNHLQPINIWWEKIKWPCINNFLFPWFENNWSGLMILWRSIIARIWPDFRATNFPCVRIAQGNISILFQSELVYTSIRFLTKLYKRRTIAIQNIPWCTVWAESSLHASAWCGKN